MDNIFETLPEIDPEGKIGCKVLQYMRTAPQYVLWRLEEANGRMTKVPYKTDGYKASSTNPRDWTTLDRALEAMSRGEYSGIGFVFTREDPLVFVDVDHCRDKYGNYSQIALKFLRELGIGSEVYRERSQSGSGLHFIVWGTLPDVMRDGKIVGGSFNNRDLGIEFYSEKHYCALTGRTF